MGDRPDSACHFCGFDGHTIRECPIREFQDPPRNYAASRREEHPNNMLERIAGRYTHRRYGAHPSSRHTARDPWETDSSDDDKLVSPPRSKSIKYEWTTESPCDLFSKNYLTSSDYFMIDHPPFPEFRLYIDGQKAPRDKNFVGILAKETNSDVNVRFRFWMENAAGTKFLEHIVLHHVFKENNLNWGVGFKKKKEAQLFDEVLFQKATVKICCKIELISATPKEDTNHALSDKLWNLYLAEEGYDTIVKAGGKDFKVSRIILMAQSEVFRNMFSRNFKEDTEKKLEIEDISAEVMQTFIKWMYTGKIDEVSHIDDLYVVADKYLITDLKTYCSNVMAFDLDNNNAAKRLTLALKHHDKELEEEILKFIGQMGSKNLLQFFASKSWIDYVLSQQEIQK